MICMINVLAHQNDVKHRRVYNAHRAETKWRELHRVKADSVSVCDI